MKPPFTFVHKYWKSVVTALVLVLIAAAAAATHQQWLPISLDYLSLGKHPVEGLHNDEPSHDHSTPAHEVHHAGHDETNSLELSQTAQKNIGLRTAKIKLQEFVKTISVPGIVVERTGRSQIDITAPMAGIVTKVFLIEGEALTAGQQLFEIRLTHEELVMAQREFLKSAEELDVVKREVARLESVGEGIVAGKTMLERKFEQQKIEAALHAQQQGLLLHGLTTDQVQAILKTRTLLQKLTVAAPQHEDLSENCKSEHSFHVQKLNVKPGQHVEAGENLCTIADHCELFIEGTAFEQDVESLNRAAAATWDVTAVLGDETRKTVPGLTIIYLSDQIDPQSRALHFYVRLPNNVIRDSTTDAHRFIVWQFRPGQRMQLEIPVEKWPDRIVLPIDAVAQDGAETYVFVPNGDHFDRRPVHVEYRDQFWAVIANDGSLFPEDIVAISSAQQMQLALKNKAGSGIDPHAGHNH